MTGRRDLIADAARSHAGCSALVNSGLYEDVIVRPVDRSGPARAYYFANPGPSTCALFSIGALRLAGCSEQECVAPYLGPPMRNAMVDIQRLARRFSAWCTSSPPVPPMLRGDIWIVTDDSGNDAHTGVCVEDSTVGSDGSWTVMTVEGGQFDGRGSTAISAFSRRFFQQGNRMRLGTRYLLGYASADKMHIPEQSGAV
jgi:hypothetical protein